MTRAVIRLILCALFNGSIPQDYGFANIPTVGGKQQNNISSFPPTRDFFLASQKRKTNRKGKRKRSRVKCINRNIANDSVWQEELMGYFTVREKFFNSSFFFLFFLNKKKEMQEWQLLRGGSSRSGTRRHPLNFAGGTSSVLFFFFFTGDKFSFLCVYSYT